MSKFKCPFCKSTDLSPNTWHMAGGEAPALECNNCYAGAPLSTWEMLNPQPITLKDWSDGQLDLMEDQNEKQIN